MEKVTLKLNKPYKRQTEDVKRMLCEEDFNAIRNVLNWRAKYRNELRKLVKGA